MHLIKGIEAPLFTVSMGPGNQAGDPREGLCLGNVFGTHLTGPILVKNPSFLDYITDLLGKGSSPSLSFLRWIILIRFGPTRSRFRN